MKMSHILRTNHQIKKKISTINVENIHTEFLSNRRVIIGHTYLYTDRHQNVNVYPQ